MTSKRGIFFTVEGIDQAHFDKLATENFSSWEDVRTTLAAESSTPEVSPPESAAKSNISKRHAAQGLRCKALERWRAGEARTKTKNTRLGRMRRP